MIPAFLALAGLIGRERPGWAFWGGTIAVVGSAVRIFQEGMSFLALQLVGVQGLETATAAVSATYGAWYVLLPLNGSDNLAWACWRSAPIELDCWAGCQRSAWRS